ncbi:MAG: inorganic polyphosphate/ATP-NAD kinase (Poly(P)/ATP NAD kinase) [Thermodesulfovibrionia bacterium]
MDINNIRRIGKRLREEIPPLVWRLHGSEAIGRGASGDKTYPLDKRAEDIIFEELERLNQPLTIISEEYGLKDIKGGGIRVLIDPIDGSKNALSGIPIFSTSISVLEGDSIKDTSMGYIINLMNGDEYWAIRDNGSFLNGRPIKTQQTDEFHVIAYEARTPRIDIPRILPLLSLSHRARCFGSTALDMAFLSQGAIDIFVTPTPSRSFDFSAGYLLINEAGGTVTDLNGNGIEDIKIGVERAIPILASANERLHKKAIEALSSFPSRK